MTLVRQALFAVLYLAGSLVVAQAETYQFDKIHTQILFFVDHFGFSKSQGEFLDFEGRFDFSKDDFGDSAVEIIIFTKSVDMDDEKWNEKMRGKQYFDTAKFPTMVFRSTTIEVTGEQDAIVHGQLTLLGNTRPVSVNMRHNKSGTSLATGNKVAGFSGSARLNRSDFGMKRHLKFIGDEIEIRLEVEGVAPRTKRKNDL